MFDPLAICLVLSANFAFGKAFPKKRKNIYGENVVITQTPTIELEADPDYLPDLGESEPNYKKKKKTLKKISKLKEKLSDNPPPNKRTKDIKNEISKLEKKLKEDDDLTIIY